MWAITELLYEDWMTKIIRCHGGTSVSYDVACGSLSVQLIVCSHAASCCMSFMYVDCCQRLATALLTLSSELNSQVNTYTVFSCSSVRSCSNFWKPWPRNFISGLQVHLSDYLGHIPISRLSDEGQGYWSINCVCVFCFGSNFWMLWPANFVFGVQVHVEKI